MNRKLLAALLISALLAGCQTSAKNPETSEYTESLPAEVAASVENDAEVNSATEELASINVGNDPESMLSDAPFLKETDTNGVERSMLDHYTITAKLDAEARSLECSQSVTYVNKENEGLSEIVFQVLPNAYRKLETAPVLFGDISSIYPNGFEPGYIDFSSIRLEGQEADYTLYGTDETQMKISLDAPVEPGDSVQIDMTYKVQIPPAYDRFGYNDTTFNIANWYPVAAVYDENGWNEDPYMAIGDPFYTDMAIYDVTYDVPETYEVASTGARVLDETKDGRRTIEYHAEYVRDTAWVTSDEWHVYVDKVDGTTIRSYYFGEYSYPEEKAVESARDAVQIFNGIYGAYPYSELAVVATDFPSGMEYPSLVMIAKDRYKSSRMNALESVIAHEIGHQWWYGVVGNDQVDEAWLDESLTVFSTAMYFGQKYGEDAYDSYVGSYRNTYESRKGDDGDGVVDKSLYDFESWTDYTNLVYRKGMLFIDALYKEYGREEVLTFMQAYYSQNKFRTSSTETFIEMGKEHFGEAFYKISDEWLYNKTE